MNEAAAERLSKRVAALRACSRREAEWLIEGGWVRVDGVVVEEPQSRVLDQTVEIDADARPEPPVPVTILWHAPAIAAGAYASMTAQVPAPATAQASAPSHDRASTSATGSAPTPALDPEHHAPDDRSGIRPLRRHFSKLTTALPLDRGASGLVVLTQDPGIVRRLEDQRLPLEQEYVVEVAGVIDDDALDRLARAAVGEGRGAPSVRVSRQSERRLRFALKGSRPGLIAALCTQAGLDVREARRLRIGRVPLAGLAPGQWRYLPLHHRF